MMHQRPCWEPASGGLRGLEEGKIKEPCTAVQQVTLPGGRRVPVLFLLLGYSKDLGSLWNPLCLISGSQ